MSSDELASMKMPRVSAVLYAPAVPCVALSGTTSGVPGLTVKAVAAPVPARHVPVIVPRGLARTMSQPMPEYVGAAANAGGT